MKILKLMRRKGKDKEECRRQGTPPRLRPDDSHDVRSAAAIKEQQR